jgi:formimidoylglutamate deiminase
LTHTTTTTWLPELLYVDGEFLRDFSLTCESGRIVSIGPAKREAEGTLVPLPNKALLPGLVNAHSHAFQRVNRGKTEYRSAESSDSFWTWRELMYAAANRMDVEDIYDASRMAFMEMALSGITTVGEFHYIHNAPEGRPYDDANLLAKEVIRAANDVGLRIALLRVAYERAGFQRELNPLQQRFIESKESYLANVEALLNHVHSDMAWVGVAPHSVRAVSLDYLKLVGGFAREKGISIHMHVAEQPAEVSACIEEYGRSPVALLDTEDLLNERFTAVHAIHVTPKAISAMSQRNSMVCACPTTERNLGDGVIPTDRYFEAGVTVALGTDSQIQIDLLEDARELEYEMRLQRKERNVLASGSAAVTTELAKRLFDCATVNGAKSLGFDGGQLKPGQPADFFTIDLNDPSIAGASEGDLLANAVFSLSRVGIKDVIVAGKRVVENGRHFEQDSTVEKFNALQSKLWK